jgi:hypothetical protein
MKRPSTFHLVELAPNARHAVADEPSVGLDLSFARTAEEAETAALPLKMGPAADQPPRLIIEMRELNLKPAFRRPSARAPHAGWH